MLSSSNRRMLLRRGLTLEYMTLSWNVVGAAVVIDAALAAGSVALAGFGLDSLIEIGASTVVIWQLNDPGDERERRALRLIGGAFVALAIYIGAQAVYTLASANHPHSSTLGIVWTAATVLVMLALAAGKARTGKALENPVLQAEGRVTLIDAYLAAAVLLGLVLNAAAGWWWADPLAGLVIVYYGLREGREVLRSRWARLVLVALATAGLAFGLATAAPDGSLRSGAPTRGRIGDTQSRPNIVFVLTDDLSWNLLRYMPEVQALQQRGLTFSNYFVTDSLCCPSRASILTGNLPHDTGVFGNLGADGGFHVFYTRGEEQGTFAVALQRIGYQTALMGKYLNGYLDGQGPQVVAPTYIPPGWTQWDGAGNGYREFNYQLNENGTLNAYGHQPADYLTDVLARKGVDFINRSAAAGRPFFLELATFAPHSPYVPAPRDANDFQGLRAPRPPSFDVLPSNAPGWLGLRQPLTRSQLDQIDSAFRLRAQSVQAVDDMIARIEQALVANHIARNTYIVFSSDNGLHTGEYRLMPGKMTAFDTDIRVPLIVVGPGVPTGQTRDQMTSNIDLAETFAALGGTALHGDGRNLVPLLHDQPPQDWRNAILIEHHGPNLLRTDPDLQQPPSGNPETYKAMRTTNFLYVEYRDGEREYYDLIADPFELHNLASMLSSSRLAQLHTELANMKDCHNEAACWAAMHVLP